MEERYSRTVRVGDAYASLREIVDGVLTVNVGRWSESERSGPDVTSQEMMLRASTMELLVQLYLEWREQSGGTQSLQETPEKVD